MNYVGESRRIGVVDCGTNTFSLLVADLERANAKVKLACCMRPRFRQRLMVRLGDGGFQGGRIRAERMAVGLDAWASIWENARNFHCDEVIVLATSAMRDASNGGAFEAAVRKSTGKPLRIISGEEEAEFIFKAVRMLHRPPVGRHALIMDIGGGSVEFIVMDSDGHKVEACSVDAGVSRLKEIGRPGDPLEAEGVSRFEPYLQDVLGPAIAMVDRWKPVELVGSAGSFDTLADLVQGGTASRAMVGGVVEEEEVGAIEVLGRVRWAAVRDALWKLPLKDRVSMPGMIPERADLMPIAAMLVDFIIQHLDQLAPDGHTTPLLRSPYSLREGVLASYLG